MAISLQKVRSLGDTVEEYAATIPYEIDGDGESLWKIVPGGRSFGYDGEDLKAFVRLCLLSLFKAGAVPVRHGEAPGMRWIEQKQYGAEPNEMADAIIAEWQAAGGGDPQWEWLWFVTRDVLRAAKLR